MVNPTHCNPAEVAATADIVAAGANNEGAEMGADFIAEARAKLQERLAELNIEREAAERALAGLDGVRGGGSSVAAASKSTPPKRRRKRARRGQRRREFLDAVRGKPGITVSQVAKQIGTAPNPFYALAATLVKEGEIQKNGPGYTIASQNTAKKSASAKARKSKTRRSAKTARKSARKKA